MRTNYWLQSQLNILCSKYFPEVNPEKDVTISFGRKGKQRLGSIKRRDVNNRFSDSFLRRFTNFFEIRDPGSESGMTLSIPSIITITGYFRDEQIPEYVVIATIAHELVHYVHGFSSPMPQMYNHPHKGKVVQRELLKRGLGDIHYDSERWLRKEWKRYIISNS